MINIEIKKTFLNSELQEIKPDEIENILMKFFSDSYGQEISKLIEKEKVGFDIEHSEQRSSTDVSSSIIVTNLNEIQEISSAMVKRLKSQLEYFFSIETEDLEPSEILSTINYVMMPFSDALKGEPDE